MNIRIRKIEKAVVFAVLVATFACVSIGTASAATHDVYPGNHSIQMAINNATAGDTIIVHDGTYTESISVEKRLTIQSKNGADSTFIHAVSEYGCRIHTDHVNLIGFTIEKASEVCGIFIFDANDCNISNNNVSGNYQGISLFNASRNTIYKNDVLANERWGISLNYSSSYNHITYNNVLNSWNGDGIYLSDSNYNTITDNDVSSNNYNGISLRTSNNNAIRNNVANANQGTGIALWSSNENIIEANKANTNTYIGIHLENSRNNNIIDNNASNNDHDGIRLWNYSSSNTISDNTISNNNWSGIVLSSSSNNTISGNDAGSNNEDGVALIYSSNNAISDNTISNNKKGIALEASSNNTISSNTISNNEEGGIYLLGSSNNDIFGNTFTNDGLVVYSSYKNVVKDNTVNGKLLVYLEETSDIKVTNAGQVILVNCTNITVENLELADTNVGVELWGTEDSLISNNTVINNYCGINIGKSINNIITGNNVSSNHNGIALMESNNNQIYFNNFIDNTGDIFSVGSNNIWNTTRLILYTYNSKQYTNYMGNYWSEYTGKDTNNDGFGDTSYGADYCPLMQPCEDYTVLAYPIFDTGAGTYPSIMGTHEGKIKPSYDIEVSNLYTYSCAGTGGHTKSIKIFKTDRRRKIEITSGTWNGYQGDWQNIALSPSVTLQAGKEYSYIIETGSYPQIIHESEYVNVTGGTISCDKFTAANGDEYTGWIPAIKLWSR